MFSSECEFYSADDMNKIKMGPAPAVSRYHSMHRFFMQSDGPNLGDHDFPNPGYLIVCSGYQLQCLPEQSMEIPEEYTSIVDNDWSNMESANDIPSQQAEHTHSAVDENQCRDKIGRVHMKRPTYGPALLVLRATKFGSSSAMTHANDILPVLTAQVKNGKTVAFIKVDNGPDWSIASIVNEVYFCRMWRDSGLDILGLVSYAARWSAYNNIEHLWSPMSKKLASVILPSVLEGDLTSPIQNNDLTDEERRQKEASLFDQSMALIKDVYWKDAQFNGSKVETKVKNCLENETPYDDYDTIHQVRYNDSEFKKQANARKSYIVVLLFQIFTGPIRNFRASKEAMTEYRFMAKHIIRKSNEIIFVKCSDPVCRHCSGRPIQCRQIWEFLKERNFKWWNPKESQTHVGHFMTFIETCKLDSEFLATGNFSLKFIFKHL